MSFLGIILPFALTFTTLGLTSGGDSDTLSMEFKIFYYFFYCLDPLMPFFMGLVYMIAKAFAKPGDEAWI